MLINGILFEQKDPIAFKVIIPTDGQTHKGLVSGFCDHIEARNFSDVAAIHASTNSVLSLESLHFVLVRHEDRTRAWAVEWMTEVIKPTIVEVDLTVYCKDPAEKTALLAVLRSMQLSFIEK